MEGRGQMAYYQERYVDERDAGDYGYGGEYRPRYGRMTQQDFARRAMRQSPKPASEKQACWIRKLIAEKMVDQARADAWLDRLNTGDLTIGEAGDIMDELFAAKDKIVAPSTLGPQEQDGRMASSKQVHWVNKLLGEKVVSEEDKAAVEQFVAEGLTGRHAGRILDYLFDAKDAGAAKGFLGQVGEEITVEGTVKTFRQIETRYGPTNLIEVVTSNGQSVKTFSKNKSFAGLAEGMTVVIQGTVKSHDTYRGAEQTMLRLAKKIG